MSAATIAATGPLLAAVAVSAAAGTISFATPCVLPLIPGYLAFVSGISGHGTGANSPGGSAKRTTMIGATLFVLGFTTIFTLLGGAFGAVGQSLARHRPLIEILGGLLVLAMGLFMLGVLPAPMLHRDSRPWHILHGGGLAAAFPLGIVFGAGWSPCIGPTLASILTLSTTDQHTTAVRGALLAFAYSLGLGTPLILFALGIGRAVRGVDTLRRHARTVELIGGTLLTIIGLLLITGLWNASLNTLRPWLGHFTSPI